jgi:hypothetical protein
MYFKRIILYYYNRYTLIQQITITRINNDNDYNLVVFRCANNFRTCAGARVPTLLILLRVILTQVLILRCLLTICRRREGTFRGGGRHIVWVKL